MDNDTHTPWWKTALKWAVLGFISAVAFDWLLDGRLRQRLPGKRRQPDPIDV